VRLLIKSRIQLWTTCFIVTAFSVVVTELSLLTTLQVFGAAAFTSPSLFYLGIAIPVLVAAPLTYVTARIGMQLSDAHADLRRLDDTDALTGLTNRRSCLASANRHLGEAKEAGKPVALLVIDADYFKQLNNTYGHATGDAALQFLAAKLAGCVRQSDLTCRLGGEEFAILLTGLSESTAEPLAMRILKKISAQPMVFDGKIIEMSVSCGIADTTVSYSMTALFKAADDALYAAKDVGRNRIILFGDSRPMSVATVSPVPG